MKNSITKHKEAPLPLLESLVVHHEALDYKLSQRLRGPNAELRRLVAVYPVAHGDDGVKIVKLHFAGNLAATFVANYFHFGNSCFAAQFSRLKNIFEMFVDAWHLNAEQFRQCLLCQPHRFVFEKDIYFHRSIGRGVQEKLVLLAHEFISQE